MLQAQGPALASWPTQRKNGDLSACEDVVLERTDFLYLVITKLSHF